VTPQYQSRIWGRVIFLLFLLVLIGGVLGFGGFYWMFHRPQGNSGRSLTFQVTEGDTVTSVANRLQADGLIDSALFFRLDARIHSLGNTLKPGAYTLHPNMSMDDMVKTLSVYKQHLINVTIPEGMRMEQIAAILQRHGIDAKSFLHEARHPNLHFLNATILNDKPAGASLEGYLFPNTYRVPEHFAGKDFARTMVDQLDTLVTPAMRAKARAHRFSMYQILTLASIVEREAVHEQERPEIAGVYTNRIRQGGWKLNADPTIQYAVGTPKNWWPVLTLAQLQVRSPYNTYTHLGLPPGPIANPGLASIKATLQPARVPYFYFVAKGNTGWHAFATTLAQQNANIAKYQH
jgi:UPF0755 protein